MIFWVGLVFWGLFIISLAAAVYALVKSSWPLMLVSAAAFYPFAWYLNATPRFRGALFVLFFCLLSALFLKLGKHKLSPASLAPVIAFTGWVLINLAGYHLFG